MKFENLTVNQKSLFDGYLTANNVAWEYNFATLLLWDVNETMKYAVDDGDLFVCDVIGCETVFMPPYLADRSRLMPALDKIRRYAETNSIENWRIRGLDRSAAEALDGEKWEISTNRDDYDYVYLADDLKYLRGKAYHSKRNFVTRFTAAYDYEFRSFTDGDRDGLLALYDSWQVDASHATLAIERRAIERAFALRVPLGLNIPVLTVGGEYAAFAVTSTAANGVNHCIFEKAETKYTGIYQAINKLTAENFFADGSLVNRQEDMGIEGLRKAKLSYPPLELLEKYSARPRRNP